MECWLYKLIRLKISCIKDNFIEQLRNTILCHYFHQHTRNLIRVMIQNYYNIPNLLCFPVSLRLGNICN